MKKFWNCALALLLVGSLVGCETGGDMSYPWSIEKSCESILNGNEYITLQVNENSITPEGCQLTFYNCGNVAVSFGNDFFIQLKKGNLWYNIKVDHVDWTAELLTIASNNKFTFDLNWSLIYGDLPIGKYRIVKEYIKEDEKSYALCEFEIS